MSDFVQFPNPISSAVNGHNTSTPRAAWGTHLVNPTKALSTGPGYRSSELATAAAGQSGLWPLDLPVGGLCAGDTQGTQRAWGQSASGVGGRVGVGQPPGQLGAQSPWVGPLPTSLPKSSQPGLDMASLMEVPGPGLQGCMLPSVARCAG